MKGFTRLEQRLQSDAQYQKSIALGIGGLNFDLFVRGGWVNVEDPWGRGDFHKRLR